MNPNDLCDKACVIYFVQMFIMYKYVQFDLFSGKAVGRKRIKAKEKNKIPGPRICAAQLVGFTRIFDLWFRLSQCLSLTEEHHTINQTWPFLIFQSNPISENKKQNEKFESTSHD